MVLAAPTGPGFLYGLLALRRRGITAILLDAAAPAAERRRIAVALGAAALLEIDSGWGNGQATLEPTACGSATAYRPGIGVVKMTSGSSGDPRGIATTDEALMADDAALFATMGLGPEDRLLAALPLSHSYGLSSLVLPSLVRGNLLIFAEGDGPDAPLVAGRALGATFFPTAPVYLQGLMRLSSPPPLPETLRTVISAGAPLPPACAAAFRERHGIPVHVFYGASECGGIAYDREGRAAERGTVGTPVEGARITVEENGLVTVRSAAVAAGYVPAADRRLEDGRYTSEDAARWVDGELELLGRLGDWINVDGRKVNPREVETVLCRLPGVEDAVVFGEPNPGRGGEFVRAVIAVGAGAPPYLEVQAWCRNQLAAHKVPRAIVRLREIPRTGRGKVDRAAVRTLAATAEQEAGA